MDRRQEKRLYRNACSKATAVNDNQPWSENEIEWLEAWDGTEQFLAELAELLGRTIEACREKFYKNRRTPTVVKVTRQQYRGWMEGDGDGWD